MSNRITFQAYGLLTLTSLIWAGNSIAGKIGSGHIDPILLTTLRWWVAMILIVALSLKPLKRDWQVIKKHWPLLLGYGASGFALFNMLLYSALTQTSVINVMIEQAGIPLTIFIGNFILFRTRVTGAQLIGFALTFIGVLITAMHGDIARMMTLQLNQGDAMMLLAVILYGGYSVCLKWKPVMHWQSLLAIPCIGAALTCIPFVLLRHVTHPFGWPDATGWGVVAYASIFVALVSTATYIAGIVRIGPNRAGLFINLLPIFGVALSIVLLSEPVRGFHILALSFVCGGIILSEWKRLRRPPEYCPGDAS